MATKEAAKLLGRLAMLLCLHSRSLNKLAPPPPCYARPLGGGTAGGGLANATGTFTSAIGQTRCVISSGAPVVPPGQTAGSGGHCVSVVGH